MSREYERALPMVEEHRRVYEAITSGCLAEATELARGHLLENEQPLAAIAAARADEVDR